MKRETVHKNKVVVVGSLVDWRLASWQDHHDSQRNAPTIKSTPFTTIIWHTNSGFGTYLREETRLPWPWTLWGIALAQRQRSCSVQTVACSHFSLLQDPLQLEDCLYFPFLLFWLVRPDNSQSTRKYNGITQNLENCTRNSRTPLIPQRHHSNLQCYYACPFGRWAHLSSNQLGRNNPTNYDLLI